MVAIAKTHQPLSVSTNPTLGPAGPNPEPFNATLSLDGNSYAFLKQVDGMMCLYVQELSTGEQILKIDPRTLSSKKQLSDEEIARRERLRLVAEGIVEYSMTAGGRSVVFCYSGEVYFAEKGVVRKISSGPEFINEVRISPDGSTVGYCKGNNLFVYDMKTQQERQITFSDDPLVHFGRAEFIAQEEMDRMQGYWLSPDGSKLAYTKVDLSPIEESTRAKIQPDGIEIIHERYPYAGQNNADVTLIVLDLVTGDKQEIPVGDNYLARVNWTPNGKLAYQVLNRDQMTLKLCLADKKEPVLVEKNPTFVNLHRDFIPLEDGERFLWTSERSGFRHLYIGSYDGHLEQITAGEWPLRQVLHFDEASETVYFTASVEDPTEQHIYAMQLNWDAPKPLTQRPGWHTGAIKANQLVHTFQGVENRPMIELCALKEGQMTKVRHISGIDQKIQKIADITFGTLKGPDGDTLHYRLAVPKWLDESKKHPAIVDVYGGPHFQSVKKVMHGGMRKRQLDLLEAGFVVFALDNRGSPNRGMDFEGAIKHEMGTLEVKDQMAGVDFLKSLPYIDQERLGVFGWSYGGYMTCKLLARHPEAFKAGAAVAPVTDWKLYDTGYTERYMGTPQGNPAGYAASSVLNEADTIQPGALLLIHGSGDDNVYYDNSVVLKGILEKNGTLFEEHTYIGKGHTMNDKYDHTVLTVVDFFKRRLLSV